MKCISVVTQNELPISEHFKNEWEQALREFALFDALREKLEPGPGRNLGWKTWPAAYSGLTTAGTIEFAQANLERIEYFEYLQWIADSQLHAVIDYCLDKQNFSTLQIQQPNRLDASGPDSWTNPDGTANADVSISPSPGLTTPLAEESDEEREVHIVTDHDNVKSLKADSAKLLLLTSDQFPA